MVSRFDRVLITGATGFTGRLLVDRLREDGCDVVGLAHGERSADMRDVDLRDLGEVSKALSQIQPSAVVHLAGIASPSHGDVSDIYSSNVIGTANLFCALEAVKPQPRIMVVASSAQVYAPDNSGNPLTEDAPLNPKSHYSVSKCAVEAMARLYSDRFPIIITRPFNYTGPGQSTNFLVPKIVEHYAKGGDELQIGNLDLYRDFSDVRRVVEAYARLVLRAVEPTVVNICSGRTIYLHEILAMMEEISGRSLKVVTNPSFVRADETRTIVGSAARLEALVGALPNPAFRDTLLRMYEASRATISTP